MLLIRCAACRAKLWKYDKIGLGEVLRCHKSRITRPYEFRREGESVKCACGREIGIYKGRYIKMTRGAFTYGGTKTRR